jgi:hypothetical protein
MREVITRHAAAPFEWGVSDCSLAFDCVAAITGFDPIANIRGYTSAAEARRRLAEAGFRDVLSLVEARFPEIAPSEAQRGDLGFVAEVAPLMSPAVINGAIAHSKALAGMAQIPRGLIVRAFAV